MRIATALLLLILAAQLRAAELHINDDQPLFAEVIPFEVSGTSDLAGGSPVTVAIGGATFTALAGTDGSWRVVVDPALATGTYELTAIAGDVRATAIVRVQLAENVIRQPLFDAPIRYGEPDPRDGPQNFEAATDRWRIAPPPYELDENPRARAIGKRGATLDPYNRNLLKGDLPLVDDWFLVLTAVSDTLAESRTVPTPSGVSTVRPGSISFFGEKNQNFVVQNVFVSADLFEGNTAFKPVSQRVKLTLIGNLTSLSVEENAIVKPDVRRGSTRRDGRVSLQELFYERKLRDLSVNYDFLSMRAGIQPFSSDFRGFVFSDTNLGVRAFGNCASNRFQYNAVLFDRLEKDTNSGLNTLSRRDQQVAVANLYWQDFLVEGYTQSFSVHLLRDGPSEHYDRNGSRVRPAPVGVIRPHEIKAIYLGSAGLGHLGRFNVDHAEYFVYGRDSLNPIAGPDPGLRDRDAVTISAGFAAIEVSYDRDWLRPRIGLLYATGDRDPRDRDATGFDSIFESQSFAGGGFSFFNRLGLNLAGTGVSLVERGTLLTSLRSSKDEGQPNYVNPGVQLLTAGLDAEITPRLKAIFTANYIRLDSTKTIETLLFQEGIRPELGTDLSLGARYRPFLNQNIVLVGGVAAFIPGGGFADIYEQTGTLYHVFSNLILTF